MVGQESELMESQVRLQHPGTRDEGDRQLADRRAEQAEHEEIAARAAGQPEEVALRVARDQEVAALHAELDSVRAVPSSY